MLEAGRNGYKELKDEERGVRSDLKSIKEIAADFYTKLYSKKPSNKGKTQKILVLSNFN